VSLPRRIVLPELPRVTLLDRPTPLHPLPALSDALGGRVELWIKREDLGPLAFSGNKLRNLEFVLGEAIANGADTVVTPGRRWSNHCRLTAAAGAKLRLAVHIVVSGPPVERSPNLELIGLLGGVLHQAGTDSRDERDALVTGVSAELEASGHRVHVIPVGGSTVTGAWGQVLAALELAEQLAHEHVSADAIVLATATGGTHAGLLVGSMLAFDPPPRVIGVVASESEANLAQAIAPKVAGLAALAGIDPPPVERIELDAGYVGPGYGMPSPASVEAARSLARTEGILVDPIYTAKGLAGLIGRVRSGELDGKRVVFWHGGGLPSLFEPLAARI
jgi:1-aminocyclopropane-1-carboxylate deaminase/D-cysteine desulfhydrase-like pyridoxal-dependent ACC family enzyme